MMTKSYLFSTLIKSPQTKKYIKLSCFLEASVRLLMTLHMTSIVGLISKHFLTNGTLVSHLRLRLLSQMHRLLMVHHGGACLKLLLAILANKLLRVRMGRHVRPQRRGGLELLVADAARRKMDLRLHVARLVVLVEMQRDLLHGVGAEWAELAVVGFSGLVATPALWRGKGWLLGGLGSRFGLRLGRFAALENTQPGPLAQEFLKGNLFTRVFISMVA